MKTPLTINVEPEPPLPSKWMCKSKQDLCRGDIVVSGTVDPDAPSGILDTRGLFMYIDDDVLVCLQNGVTSHIPPGSFTNGFLVCDVTITAIVLRSE